MICCFHCWGQMQTLTLKEEIIWLVPCCRCFSLCLADSKAEIPWWKGMAEKDFPFLCGQEEGEEHCVMEEWVKDQIQSPRRRFLYHHVPYHQPVLLALQVALKPIKLTIQFNCHKWQANKLINKQVNIHARQLYAIIILKSDEK